METANTLKTKLVYASAFIAVAFIFSLIALLIPEATPRIDSHKVWFQRSGSFIVIASIWAEFILIRTEGYLDPYNEKYMVLTDMPASLNNLHRHLSKAAIVFALYGTLVWGYGDLLINVNTN